MNSDFRQGRRRANVRRFTLGRNLCYGIEQSIRREVRLSVIDTERESEVIDPWLLCIPSELGTG